MKVEWSAFAMEDRDRIFDYIESESPKAAVRVNGCIEEQANQLAQFPEFGRPGRVDGTRELVISHTRYITPYRVDGDAVRILRVPPQGQPAAWHCWASSQSMRSSNAKNLGSFKRIWHTGEVSSLGKQETPPKGTFVQVPCGGPSSFHHVI